MQGKIITVDYAETNNLNTKSVCSTGYIKKIYGYVYQDKGMGRATEDKPTWKPKKPADERFIVN